MADATILVRGVVQVNAKLRVIVSALGVLQVVRAHVILDVIRHVKNLVFLHVIQIVKDPVQLIVMVHAVLAV